MYDEEELDLKTLKYVMYVRKSTEGAERQVSAKVSRGVKGNLRDYKSGGTPKHGYIRDSEGIYREDGDNFVILQKAWHMRADGVIQQEICDFINSQGYQKFVTKSGGHVTWTMTDSVLSNIFKDTFYFGELVQAGETIDLVKAPVPFKPMIDRDLYFMVQELSRPEGVLAKLAVSHSCRCAIWCSVMSVSFISQCRLVVQQAETRYPVLTMPVSIKSVREKEATRVFAANWYSARLIR